MKKMLQIFLAFIAFIILVNIGGQVFSDALAPYMKVIGFILTLAIAFVVLGGIGFVCYVLYQRFKNSNDDRM